MLLPSERNEKLEKAERMSKKSNLLVDNNSAFFRYLRLDYVQAERL